MTDDSDVSTRLGKLEDRVALWELVSRYSVAIDDKAYDALERMFARDAEFVGRVGEPARGREDIVAYLRHRRETAQPHTVHTPTSQFLDDLTEDTARGMVSSYVAIYDQEGQGSFLAFRYHDEYVHEDGRWQFARRHPHHHVRIIPPEVPSASRAEEAR